MEITSHVVEGDSAPQIKIEATDQPGAGGAYHRYSLTGPDFSMNGSFELSRSDDSSRCTILFQNGPIPEHGVNGLTIEALLAVCQHRLECFQAGDYPSQENATALQNVNEALRSLQKRTRTRIARGVEGKLQA